MKKQAQDLQRGDLLDLEGDEYADPDNSDRVFPFEKAVVMAVEQETPTCIRVDTNAGSFGVPPDHVFDATLLAEA